MAFSPTVLLRFASLGLFFMHMIDLDPPHLASMMMGWRMGCSCRSACARGVGHPVSCPPLCQLLHTRVGRGPKPAAPCRSAYWPRSSSSRIGWGQTIVGVFAIARRRAMKSLVIKRSIIFNGRKTSVSLEDDFWNALRDIAHGRGETLSRLIASINANRQSANLSSVIRLFVLRHHMDQFARQREMFTQQEIPVQ